MNANRTTIRTKRTGSGGHLDRTNTGTATHINEKLSPYNRYECIYPGMAFEDAERRFYAENLQGMIDDINQKAIKSRHLERLVDVEKIHSSKKFMPEEEIFQIGNRKSHATPEQLMAVYEDFHKWHNQKFGKHIVRLDMALHVDEATPHIHERHVWLYEDSQGFKAINQHKALEQLGYTLPDPDRPRSQTNNLKIPYTAECRQKWIEICREHGLNVIAEPEKRAPNRKNIAKGDFIIMNQDKQIAANESRLEFIENEIQQQLTAGQRKIQASNAQIYDLSEEVDKLHATTEKLKIEAICAQETMRDLKQIESGTFKTKTGQISLKNVVYAMNHLSNENKSEVEDFLQRLSDAGKRHLQKVLKPQFELPLPEEPTPAHTEDWEWDITDDDD